MYLLIGKKQKKMRSEQYHGENKIHLTRW